MEREENASVSNGDLEAKIKSLLSDMKKASPQEIEEVKLIIKKNVPFFTRSAFAAFLLMTVSENKSRERFERKPRIEKKERFERERNDKNIKAEKRERPEKPEMPREERVIPEDAKTLYINVGKMKRLYAKDLSKLLQSEIGVTRDDIYMIRIHDKYSFVTMSPENCEKAIEKLKDKEINGRVATITYAERRDKTKKAEPATTEEEKAE